MVLVGPSGSGKTTALRMLAGLESVTAGSIAIGEKVVNKIAPRERDIAMVFQDYALYPQWSVFDNLAFGLRRRKVPKDEIQRRVAEAARVLDLEPYLAAPPGPAQRRPGAAGRSGARARPRAAGLPDGRAVEQPGREAAHADPRRDPAAAAGGPHDHGLRHPRPGRGDDDGRPHRGHEPRRARAGRHARGPLRAAREPLRRRLHRLARDVLHRGRRPSRPARGRRRRRAARARAAVARRADRPAARARSRSSRRSGARRSWASTSARRGWSSSRRAARRATSASRWSSASSSPACATSTPRPGRRSAVNDADLVHLRRAVELAEIALEAGEEPYGSVLVGADGTVLFEDHNRTSGGDQTRHPEFEIARWAANHVAPEDRAGRDRLHVGRALRDVLGGARVGRARADRDRGVVAAAARLGGRPGRVAAARRRAADQRGRPGPRRRGPAPGALASACASCSAASSRG